MNILLVIGIALVFGLLSTRLMKVIGMPNVTGYLIVGLIIGPYALGIIPNDSIYLGLDGTTPVTMSNLLGIVSTVALGFIAFSIGVEFKLSHIKQIGKSAVTITFFQALSATVCVDAILLVLGKLIHVESYEALILGAVATATAPAATLMVVRQYRAKGIVTSTLLPVVALDDAVGLVVFAISNSIALSLVNGAAISVLSVVVWPICEILASLVIGGAIGGLLSIIPRFFHSRDNRLIATITAVFLCLGVCELFNELEDSYGFPFGLSDLLVCMMAGAVFVNVRKEATVMMEGTDRWTPVVLMLFFILSGAELNVASFFEDAMLLVCIIVYILARCFGKYFGTVLGASITNSDKNVKKYLGITLFPQAGVAIGMATMCKKEFTNAALSATNPELSDKLLLVGSRIVTITMCAVLIYELVGPLLTKWALTKAGEINLDEKSSVSSADAQ